MMVTISSEVAVDGMAFLSSSLCSVQWVLASSKQAVSAHMVSGSMRFSRQGYPSSGPIEVIFSVFMDFS